MKTILLFICFFIMQTAHAQFAVIDAGSNAQLAVTNTQLTQLNTLATEQSISSKTQLTFFQKIYEKTSSAIKTVSTITNVIYYSKSAYSSCQRTINHISQNQSKLSISYVNRAIRNIDNSVNAINQAVEECAKLLSNDLKGGFKMSDYERYDLIQKQLTEVKKTTNELETLERKTENLLIEIDILETFK